MSGSSRGRFLRALSGWGRGVAVAQLMNGSIEVSLTPHYPALERSLHVSLALWGTLLTGLPVGLLFGALIGGWLAHRVGSRAALVLGALVFFLAPPFAAVVTVPALFWVVLFVAGLGNGVLDVAWGLQSTGFELRHRKDPRYANANLGFQAMFSLGSVLGVGSAALALKLQWATLPHMAVVAAVALSAVLLTARHLPSAPERDPHPDGVEGAGTENGGALAGSGWLVFSGLCVASFFAFFPLGVAYAWSTPYLQSIGAKSATAAFALIAYTVFEGVGRLLAQKWQFLRVNERRTVFIGGLVALAGAFLIVGPATPVSAIAGFGLLSLGLAPAGPIVQSVSNRVAQVRRRALRMTLLTISGYLGGVVGQPAISGIAALSSLRVSIGIVGLCALVILALCRAIPGRNSR